MSNLINIYSLRKKKSQRERQRLEIYQTVLKKCHRRIHITAESAKNDSSVCFTIPNMIIGMPAYDLTSCAEYIVHHLTMNGFRVALVSPEQLFISWAHIDYSSEKEMALDEKIQDLQFMESGQLFPRINNYPEPSPPDKSKEKFRPLYDTPSTEKFLLT
jgi:hypothetical protein